MTFKKIKITHLLMVLVIITAIVFYAEAKIGLFSRSLIKSKPLTPDGITYEYGSDSKAVFSKGEKGFLCVTKDGATYYTYKGDALWRQTFTMNDPYIVQSGDSFAVLEPMGTIVYVCDATGVRYTAPTEYSILSAGINRMNCLILIVQSEDNRYKIQIYNQDGAIPIERKTELEGVFPVCADLTEDSLMFAAGYLDTSKSALSSRVLYNYTDYGAKKLAKDALAPFKAIERADSIVSRVHFSKDDYLAIATDNEILITTKYGEDAASVVPSNRIGSLVFSDSIFGIISGEALPGAENPDPKGLCRWYDYNGREIGRFADEEILEMAIYDELLILKSQQNYYCVDKNGYVLWSVGAAQDITAVIPIDKKRALIAKTSFAEIYSIKAFKMPASGSEE